MMTEVLGRLVVILMALMIDVMDSGQTQMDVTCVMMTVVLGRVVVILMALMMDVMDSGQTQKDITYVMMTEARWL